MGLCLSIGSCHIFGSAEEWLWNEADQGKGVYFHIPAEPDGNAASFHRFVEASLPPAQITTPARSLLRGVEEYPTPFTYNKP
jgi:hypothetical protein